MAYYYNGQCPFQMPNIPLPFNTGPALGYSAQEKIFRTQPFLMPNDQSSFYEAPQQHPYAAPQQNYYAAPQQHPYAAPQQHPYAAPQQHPYASPQQHPYAEPQQHPYASPQQHPYAAPQRPCSNQGPSKNLVPASHANGFEAPQKPPSSNGCLPDQTLIQSFFQGSMEKAFEKVLDLKQGSAGQAPLQPLENFKIPSGSKSGEYRRMVLNGNCFELVKWGPGESESAATQGKK